MSEMYVFRLLSSAFPANLLRPINRWKHMICEHIEFTSLYWCFSLVASSLELCYNLTYFYLYFFHLYYPSFHSNLYPFKIIEELGAQILGGWISTLLPVSSTECNFKFWAENLEQQPEDLEKYMIAGWLGNIRTLEIKFLQDQWCIYDFFPPFAFCVTQLGIKEVSNL